MKRTFTESLKKSGIAIRATANNSEGDDIWAKRVGEKKAQIERGFKRTQRPYVSIIQRGKASPSKSYALK